MGLDMYLKAEQMQHNYEWAKEKNGENETFNTIVTAIKASDIVSKDSPVLSVELTVQYWRKANAIHAWFVNNVQNGIDDCKEYDVSMEQLANLRDVCREIMLDPDKASKLLPTREGFFFGGTDYDEYYYEQLEQTYFRLDKLITEFNGKDEWFITYRSSW